MTYYIAAYYFGFSFGLLMNTHSQNWAEYCRLWKAITDLGPVTRDVWFVIMNTIIFNIFPSVVVVGLLFGPIIFLISLLRK
jgi:hypothetical protein